MSAACTTMIIHITGSIALFAMRQSAPCYYTWMVGMQGRHQAALRPMPLCPTCSQSVSTCGDAMVGEHWIEVLQGRPAAVDRAGMRR